MNINSHPWFDPEALVGTAVGGYQLNKLAGSGGFGAVYVTESQNDIPLALKLLYPPFSNRPEDLESWTRRATHFLREAQTAASFHQPNIIRVYDTGQFLWHYDDTRGGTSGGGNTGDYLLPYYVADYFPDGKSWAIRLHEKNDKVLTMPVHHRLEAFLDEYIQEAGGAEAWPKDKQGYGKPLFRSSRRQSRTRPDPVH